MTPSCYYHPERKGIHYCQADEKYMCDECGHCPTPQLHCKFRNSCIINLLSKEGILTSHREGLQLEPECKNPEYEEECF